MRPTNGTSNDHNTSATNDNNDNSTNEEYDPQYDPIIALPDEIEVSTGEENEIKLFGERAKLFRFDFENKEVRKSHKTRQTDEGAGLTHIKTQSSDIIFCSFFSCIYEQWKERGVGEFKILHHPDNHSFRLLLRREQIHKLVLNMALTGDIKISPMKQSDKAFCWVGPNYAEKGGEGETESLSVRFKNADLANQFNDHVQKCIEKLQERERGQ